MKKHLLIATIAVLSVFSACGPNEEMEKSRREQDSIDKAKQEARKNAPAKAVTWAELQAMKEDEINDSRTSDTPIKVEIVGYLAVPSQIYTSQSSIRCDLFQRPNQTKGYHVNLEFTAGNKPNHMEMLGAKYSIADFKVHTHDEEIVGQGALVKIKGEVYHNDPKEQATIYVTKVVKAEPEGEPDFSSAVEYKAQDEATLPGKLVYITGSLDVGFMLNTIGANCYMLHMTDVKDKEGSQLGINIPIGNGNNQMSEVGDNFSKSSVKIRDDKGNKVVLGKKVKVYGVFDDIGGIYLEKIVQ